MLVTVIRSEAIVWSDREKQRLCESWRRVREDEEQRMRGRRTPDVHFYLGRTEVAVAMSFGHYSGLFSIIPLNPTDVIRVNV